MKMIASVHFLQLVLVENGLRCSGKQFQKVWCLGGAGGGTRTHAKADVQQRTAHTFETFHCQPRIRPLRTATD